MHILHEYKGAFSLRDEMGTFPNIEVKIDVMKTLFLLRPYHVKEEDKQILVQEMKIICYMGILKKGFSAYSSLFMLISRKMMKDKKFFF